MRSLVVLAILIIHWPSISQTNPSQKPPPGWSSKMVRTATSFSELLPYLYNESEFSNLENFKKVSHLIQNFNASIHKISKKSARSFVGNDPYVLRSIEEIQSSSQSAVTQYKKKNYKTAQLLLRSTTGLCFKCHTRIPTEKTNLFWSNLKVDQFNVPADEKTRIYIAMRKFDKALKHIKNKINSPIKNNNQKSLNERLIKQYLYITVRALNSPQKGLGFLESLRGKSVTSNYFQSKIPAWKKDLLYWSAQEERAKKKMKIENIIDIKNNKIISLTDEDLVKQLLATRHLHNRLREKIKSKEKAKTYFYLGQLYEKLVEGGHWELPEIYYEICITTIPKTQLAQKCFRRYKANVTLGYSGSRGVFIPDFAQKKVEELRKIAGLK